MSGAEWAALARWWLRRAELHESNGRVDRAKIARDRAATAQGFADKSPPATRLAHS